MRKAGWMSALKEQDIIPPESWIGAGTPDMPGGEAAMVELLGRNLQLTAVFAYNDNMAAGALTALKDNGIAIPLHLSIIGFDDIPIARYTRPAINDRALSHCFNGEISHRTGLAGGSRQY
ncbi:DNA-binding transcriptional regulator GalS [Escherichia coli]|nr:DNA-binding transcriptional regulator GalS [Escherichia coli]